MGFSLFVAMLLFVPNSFTDRVAIAFCAVFAGSVGMLLYWHGTHAMKASAGSKTAME